MTKILFVVLSAVDKHLSNPNSPLSVNSDANDLRRLYSFSPNGRMNLTLSLMRSPQRSTSASSSPLLETEDKDEEIMDFPSYSSYRFDSDLLPPPPETWSDSDMTSLIDQAIEAEKIGKIE